MPVGGPWGSFTFSSRDTMITRRQFLGVSSLAVAGTAASCQAPSGSTSGSNAAEEQDLPLSIAALTSQAHRAAPISNAEREARIDRARGLMAANGLDALMLNGGTSMLYFTNIRWGLSERLFAVVVPVRGQAFVVTPAFEEDRTREQLAQGPLADAEVLTWQEDESPYDLVASGLRPGTSRRDVSASRRPSGSCSPMGWPMRPPP